jgi:hypothetical protein
MTVDSIKRRQIFVEKHGATVCDTVIKATFVEQSHCPLHTTLPVCGSASAAPHVDKSLGEVNCKEGTRVVSWYLWWTGSSREVGG